MSGAGEFPRSRPNHRYRIVDAANAKPAASDINDLRSGQPWLDRDPTVPLDVISSDHPVTSDGAVGGFARRRQVPISRGGPLRRLRPVNPDPTAIEQLNWDELTARLDHDSVAITPPLLTSEQCRQLIEGVDEPALFRSTVVMQRNQFGRGVYRYYADPASVRLIQQLRERLHPPMAAIANRWAGRLGGRDLPGHAGATAVRVRGHRSGSPTPLILHYDPWRLGLPTSGHLPRHRVSAADHRHAQSTGTRLHRGENVLVEQRRFQSRAVVVPPQRGQGMIFPVRHRPVRGTNGFRRHAMRHGTNAVETGERNTLGIIFHNAR